MIWIGPINTVDRTCSLGKGISIFLSRRPGRSSAGSRVSGLLVAIMIFTRPNVSNPSIWLSSSINVLWISRSADVPSENRRAPTNKTLFFPSSEEAIGCGQTLYVLYYTLYIIQTVFMDNQNAAIHCTSLLLQT